LWDNGDTDTGIRGGARVQPGDTPPNAQGTLLTQTGSDHGPRVPDSTARTEKQVVLPVRSFPDLTECTRRCVQAGGIRQLVHL
jgi:hypothetical protein